MNYFEFQEMLKYVRERDAQQVIALRSKLARIYQGLAAKGWF